MSNTLLRVERRLKVMGGPALLVIDIPHDAERAAEKTLDKAIELLADLESRYSRYQPKSLISKINNCAGSAGLPS